MNIIRNPKSRVINSGDLQVTFCSICRDYVSDMKQTSFQTNVAFVSVVFIGKLHTKMLCPVMRKQLLLTDKKWQQRKAIKFLFSRALLKLEFNYTFICFWWHTNLINFYVFTITTVGLPNLANDYLPLFLEINFFKLMLSTYDKMTQKYVYLVNRSWPVLLSKLFSLYCTKTLLLMKVVTQ